MAESFKICYTIPVTSQNAGVSGDTRPALVTCQLCQNEEYTTATFLTTFTRISGDKEVNLTTASKYQFGNRYYPDQL